MKLELLLCGMDVKSFQSKFWDSTPIKFDGNCELFSDKISASSIEQTATQRDARYPIVKLIQNGKILNSAQYTKQSTLGGVALNDQIDVPALYSLWNEGATIILHSLDENDPELIPIARSLENEIGHPISFNAYLTPANSFGFKIHFDRDDVFIVQLEGTKRWKVWGDRENPVPLTSESFADPDVPDADPVIDTTLRVGEVLYIPRGYKHCAMTDDETSLHVTIGVFAYRHLDAVQDVLNKLMRELTKSTNPKWRASLPLGGFDENDDGFSSSLADVKSILNDIWKLDETTANFVGARRPDNLKVIGGDVNPDAVTSCTQLTLPGWMKPVVKANGQGIAVVYQGRTLELPKALEPVLRRIITNRTTSPSEMTDMDEASAVKLAVHLVREGLLIPANQDSDS